MIFSDRYRIGDRFGKYDEQVFAAEDLTNGEQVAVKIDWKNFRYDNQIDTEKPLYEKLVDIECVPRIHG